MCITQHRWMSLRQDRPPAYVAGAPQGTRKPTADGPLPSSANAAPSARPGCRQRLAKHIQGLPETQYAAGMVVQGVPHPPNIGRVHLPEVRELGNPVPHQPVRVPGQPPLSRVVRTGKTAVRAERLKTSVCTANSLPLSAVIVSTGPNTGPGQSMIEATASAAVLRATGWGNVNFDTRSTSEAITPLWRAFTIVSTSRSPTRTFPSTITGRSGISTRPKIMPRPAPLRPRRLRLLPRCQRHRNRSPPAARSAHMRRYIHIAPTFARPPTASRTEVCDGLHRRRDTPPPPSSASAPSAGEPSTPPGAGPRPGPRPGRGDGPLPASGVSRQLPPARLAGFPCPAETEAPPELTAVNFRPGDFCTSTDGYPERCYDALHYTHLYCSDLE